MEKILVYLDEVLALLDDSCEPLLRWLELPSIEVLRKALQKSDLGDIHTSLIWFEDDPEY